MRALRRNFVPILVAVAAVLVSAASLAVIVEAFEDDDERTVAGPFFSDRSLDERSRVPFGRALLGVSVETRDGTLVVTEVEPGSPAERAGVRAGDALLRTAGRNIGDVGDLRRAIADARPGEQYDLVVCRDGSEQTLKVDRQGIVGAFGLPVPLEQSRPGAIPFTNEQMLDDLLDRLADEVADRLSERGFIPPTATPSPAM